MYFDCAYSAAVVIGFLEGEHFPLVRSGLIHLPFKVIETRPRDLQSGFAGSDSDLEMDTILATPTDCLREEQRERFTFGLTDPERRFQAARGLLFTDIDLVVLQRAD